MRKVISSALLLAAVTVHADDRRLIAGDTGVSLRKSGKIVIENDKHVIRAFRFFDNVREALVTLRATRVVATQPYKNAALFNGNAPISQTLPAPLGSIIAEASRAHGVDPRLVAAVARRESAFNPNAVSRVGACGIMQLMPATANYLGINNVFDARENVFGGTRYLRRLLDTFNGDLDLTLAAYNAGPGAVQRYKGVPPYGETRAYVAAVRSSYERSLLSE